MSLIRFALIRFTLTNLVICGAFLWWGCSDSSKNSPDTESETDSPTEMDSESSSDTTSDSDSATGSDSDSAVPAGPIVINEVMSKNDGVVLDEALETEDWIELMNIGDEPVLLSNYTLSDNSGVPAILPEVRLGAGEVTLFFADNEPEQGEYHLDFKVSASGETLSVAGVEGALSDMVEVPPLVANVSYARHNDGSGFQQCRYATPGELNGDCSPPLPPGLQVQAFAPYKWPTPPYKAAGPIVLNELALRPASFIEIGNSSSSEVDLATYQLEVSAIWPGEPWPEAGEGVVVPLTGIVAPGEIQQIPIDATVTLELEADENFEGVITVFDSLNNTVSDRLDFMSWPQNAVLARVPDNTGTPIFCTNPTPGAQNSCTPLLGREIGNRLRYLRTPADFKMLAAGGDKLGIGSVKFVMDLEAGEAVHLLSSETWDLHYTFVRDVIEGRAHLDRCDPEENQEFNAGWRDFSVNNYYSEARRYILGTLSHHGGTDIHAVEYTFGDAITPNQMVQGFFGAAGHTLSPTQWYLRPQDDIQVARALEVEGQVPIVGTNAPFAGITYQPLSEAVGYGYLTYIETDELESAALGPQTIVVTNDVPNDIPLVGGLITQAFQTPLAHVNLLSQARGTPNMALQDASTDPGITDYLGQLVRLKVDATHFEISVANPEDAQAFWDSLLPEGPKVSAQLDESATGLVSLDGTVGFEDIGSIGAKAAQISELHRITVVRSYCDDTLSPALPPSAFAIPVSYYLAHFENSGASAQLEQFLAQDSFHQDPVIRAEALATVRATIKSHGVDTTLLQMVEQAVSDRFGDKRVRFRSSSNTEDLASFNGAGLYTSQSGQLGSDEYPIEDAIKTVWASIWNARAYDERQFANIDHSTVAMGVLVHPAYLSEEANGVAVSRDITEPNRGDRYYVNVQAGEATVTNPAPGVTSEQFIYQWPTRTPTLRYRSQSSLVDSYVMIPTPRNESDLPGYGDVTGEIRDLMCALWSVHDHFNDLLNPDGDNPWFAMEVEFKLQHDTRKLAIKQARPFSFGTAQMPTDCREL